jgi:transcriptional regulator with PAS, ATPase and Fis domain
VVRRGAGSATPEDVVIASPSMQRLYELAARAAASSVNVLVLGENGVGKEVLVQAIHRQSPRAREPLRDINCAALPESLLESELFGHEKGAFSGATQTKIGLLEAASGGTVFFDEIGEMSPALQAKLLRVIETKQLVRVGGVEVRPIDVRFVAATNRDLEEEIAEKRFREDLYYRLNTVTLEIPPLRERREEIEPLSRRFLERAAIGRVPPEISPAALALLEAWSWPGNIRELRNAMERALLLCTGATVLPEHLPDRMRQAAASAPRVAAPPAARAEGPGAGPAPGASDKRQVVVDALARCAWNQTRAAELLGVSRRTLCSWIKELGIPRPRS